ncbi:MAG: restriction endonuclease, partial [Terriglobia bacterium]
MSEQLPSHFIDLAQDALLKSFWRKNALLTFLRRHKIAESFLATWQETETKRMFVGRLFPKLESDNKGDQVI